MKYVIYIFKNLKFAKRWKCHLKKYVFPEISLSKLIIRKNKNVFEIKIHGEIYNIYKFRLIELSSIKSFLLLGIL